MSWKSVRRLLVVLLCVQLTVQAVLAAPPLSPVKPAQAMSSAVAGIIVVESDATHLALDLQFAEPTRTTVERDGVSYTQVSLGPDFGATALAGHPQLPQTSRLAALPPGAHAVLSIEGEVWQTAPVAHALLPAPRFDFASPTDVADGAPVASFFEPDAQAYAADAWTPATLASLGETARLRDQDVIQVIFSPVRYNPVRGEIAWLRQARVTVNFQGGQPTGASRPDPYFETTLAGVTLNYEAARAWRTTPAVPNLPDFVPASSDLRIVVRDTGIYQITYDDLVNLGYDDIGGWPTSHFAMFHKDGPIARWIEDGNSNGFMDPGDAIFFYGQAPTRIYYTFDNIYWLRIANPTPGLEMTSRSTPPDDGEAAPYFKTTLRTWQENWRWSQHMAAWQAWWWDQFTVSYPNGSRSYNFDLPAVASVPYSATISVRIGGRYSWPEYNPDHHNRVYINGSPTATIDAFWDGRILIDLAGDVAQAELVEGTNSLRLETIVSDVGRPANARVDWTYFKWVDATYYRLYTAVNDELAFSQHMPGSWLFNLGGFSGQNVRVFDITDPRAPVRLTDGVAGPSTFSIQDNTTPDQRFLAVGPSAVRTPYALSMYMAAPINLRDVTLQKDYIFITHPLFRTALQPLVSFRESQGYRVVVANIDWVYDQFNAGIMDTEAIRSFLNYAYSSWTAPVPAYTLLVGGSNFNPHGYNTSYYGPQQPVYLPTIDLNVDPFQGESAADAWFAAVSGNDPMPDLHIGRLPVSSTADLTTAVNKIIAYELNPTRGAWQNDILFVADNTDDAGNFEAISEAIIASYLTSPSWELRKVYYNPNLVNPPDPYYNTVDLARGAIRSKWSQGVAIGNYVGHAFLDYWGSTVTDQQWHNNDTPTLTNGSKLPFLISLDCLDGYFDYPNRPAMAEKFLTHNNGGVVAHFAPSGLGIATGHDYLHRGFYNAIVNNNVRQTGPIVMAAKLNLYTGLPNYFQDLIYTFGLIGDPATTLTPLCRVTDVNCDNNVNIVDIQKVAARWNYSSGQSGYASRYDVNNDGVISISDIIIVTSDYGWQP